MTPLPLARRANYHGQVGRRRESAPAGSDYSCLICGRPVYLDASARPRHGTPSAPDLQRDHGHTPRPCPEVPAGSEAQRVMGQRAGGPTPTDLQLRRLNGARSW